MQKTEEFNLHGVFSGRSASAAGRNVIFEQLQFSASLCVLTALLFELWYLPFKFKIDGEKQNQTLLENLEHYILKSLLPN